MPKSHIFTWPRVLIRTLEGFTSGEEHDESERTRQTMRNVTRELKTVYGDDVIY